MDALDRKIIEVLQRDGRITNAALAELVHLSPSACYERVRRLEKTGVIASYRAGLALDALGRSVTVLATVALGSHEHAAFQRFEAAIKRIPEVVECFKVSGAFDYVLRLVCPDMARYHAVSEALLSAGPPVAQLHSYVVLEHTKDFTGYPLDRLL
jgi:Lrp/AsnC family transcriptional regulator, leucine-responsive regulatory protein